MADHAALHFLPWVRQGLAAGIPTADSLTPGQAAQVSLPVTVTLAQFDVTSQIRLAGPADVTAIDPRQIVRTEPRHLTTNFAVNLFPHIEFDRPDFPWLFTPAKPGQHERLRPWLCLVVVKKQDGVRLTATESSSLTRLQIQSPARPGNELPDLMESWAWAHAQVTGSMADQIPSLKAAIDQAPERTLSRLLCPRRLDQATAYYACLVPTFEVGRKTGLGLPVPDEALSQLAPAWQQDAAEVLLPVYFSWEFSTGREGDFESLVRLLQPRPIPAQVGTIPLDIGRPGFGLPEQTDAVVPMSGLLQPVPVPATPPPAVPSALTAGLVKILNAPADALLHQVTDPIVAPPIYGATYPPKERVDLTDQPPPWLNELNLDPRHRIAANFGTQVVQQDQDALMASAWQQIDAVQKENLDRRRRQLALVNRTLLFTKHLSRLDPDALLQITGPSLTKVAASETTGAKTVATDIWSSEFPAFCTTLLRRVARPRGSVNRRFLPAQFLSTHTRPLVKLLDHLPTVPPKLPFLLRPLRLRIAGMVTPKRVSDAAGLPLVDVSKMTPAKVQAEPSHGFFIWKVDHWERSSVSFGQEFRQAAFDHLNRVVRPSVVLRPTFTTPNIQTLLNNLKPRTAGMTAQPRGPVTASEEDDILAHPQFDRPMSERLIDLVPEFLLPGLESVPANSVTLVQANNRLIEAFMLGLNHEMGRELLWREYPTDRRGTYFRSFWDQRGAQADGRSLTLPPIHDWAGPLGQNGAGAGTTPLILLVRGELLRRYPTAVIFAAKAQRDQAWRLTPSQTARYPLFRGSAPPDVTFFGFDLREAEVRGDSRPDGDPGWFFVIQQQPGEPAFGLDVDPGGQPPRITKWSDLTWRHLVRSEEDLARLTYVRVAQGNPPLPDTSADPPGARWGENAAHMARITWQQPVRIAIHAGKLLPPVTGGRPHA